MEKKKPKKKQWKDEGFLKQSRRCQSSASSKTNRKKRKHPREKKKPEAIETRLVTSETFKKKKRLK